MKKAPAFKRPSDWKRLNEQVDIVELVASQDIELVQEGSVFKGLCPFHPDERTKSFTVFPETNTWHCFGCKAGSSVIDFVMKKLKLDFVRAVQYLEERLGTKDTEFSVVQLETMFSDFYRRPSRVYPADFTALRQSLEGMIWQSLRSLFLGARQALPDSSRGELSRQTHALWKWHDKMQQKMTASLASEKVDWADMIELLRSMGLEFSRRLNDLRVWISRVRSP